MNKKICVALASTMLVAGAGNLASAETTVTKSGVELMKRYSGADRFQTAVDVSKGNYPNGSSNVILVNGSNPADALSGGPLAYSIDSPILLVNAQSISTATLNELVRLNPTNVYILGGEKSVSSNLEKLIKGKLKSTTKFTRISGSDRYETSVRVAEVMLGNKSFSGAGFVNGDTNKFPDALSAAALLGKKGMPLILTNGKSLSGSMTKYKSNSSNYIIGGAATINIPGLSGKRIAGNDRYDTSARVATEGFTYGSYNSSSDSACVIVDGRNYPDALTAISVAKKQNGPILLVDKQVPTPIVSYINAQKRDKAYMVGGMSSVSLTVQNDLLNRLENNYKNYRSSEVEKRRLALSDLEKAMSKYDEMVGWLSKSSSNLTAINEYKTLRDQLYKDYTSKSAAALVGVTVETIASKKSDLAKRFEDIAKINDDQYNTILRAEVDKAYDKISERGILLPESQMTSSQKELYSKLKEATRLMTDASNGKRKLELTYEIKHSSVSSSSSSSDSNSQIREANELLNKAKDIRTQSPEFLSKKASLDYAIADARKSATSTNLQNLKDAAEDFRYVLNAYLALDDKIKAAEKLIKDNKSTIEYAFRSKAYKEVDVPRESSGVKLSDYIKKKRSNIEDKIADYKRTMDSFNTRTQLNYPENELNGLIDELRNVIRSFDELKILDSTIKTCEDSEPKGKTFNEDKAKMEKLLKVYKDLFDNAKQLKDKAGSEINLSESSYDKIRSLNKALNDAFNEYRTEYSRSR
ncbi:cell wall-binding repeat-containing protein [Peptostreptococcus sp. D1]|uniref:cell wall-binding repeat-containing protein n=1 Tax=Peptostreptococcus sp. D1 TaxID=72304 RepID=UPI0008EE5BF1|nr:cell wall-binding repeat-containing protein [Peptostreptococcus sp. D1]SFE86250.1 Putative cell wall binding repeat 2 [Peptostreptococcus sp. D1]